MPKLLLRDLKENENFESAFLVNQKSLLVSKTNRPYLSLKLADKSGEAEGRVWDNVESLGSRFEKNDFIRVVGRPVVYQDKIQLNIVQVERLNPDEISIEDFLPVSKRDIGEMAETLLGFIRNEVKNPWIRKFLLAIFEDPEILNRVRRAPAAKTNHHAWVGGLLEHIVHLCELGRDVLKHYPSVNPDLVYTGLMLHDIGKIYEMTYERFFSYTDEGQMVGHLIQGVEMVYEKIRSISDFPERLKTHIVHIILSHHGKLEFGSPKLPMTLEAIMVHYLDDMDSKLQGVLDLAEKENSENPWTNFNRLFGRPMYKSSLPDMEESLKWSASPPSIPESPPKNSAPQRKPRPHEPLTTSLADQLKKTLGEKS
jgi:3'-5' exoribonuclease